MTEAPAPPRDNAIEVKDLIKRYGERAVVDGLSFSVQWTQSPPA